MRIKLEGLLNVRDLGGIAARGGRKIKYGRIVRSDNLSPATENDCLKLQSYGIKKIVDFRTDDEIKQSPDKEIPGGVWIKNPILKELTTGITREAPKEYSCLEELLLDFSMDLGERGKEWLAGLYIPLVSDEFCLKGYRRFLEILKDNKNGAVLYHCSAGKDRVGVGTMLFLTILGVSREDIIKDYLLTNESYADAIERTRALGRERGVSQAVIDTIEPLSGVDVSYINTAFDTIDRVHGGMDTFLKNQLGIDEGFINELCQNYLE